MYVTIILVSVLMWSLWILNVDEFRIECQLVYIKVIENDFEYYATKVKQKTLNEVMNERIIYSLLGCFIFVCLMRNQHFVILIIQALVVVGVIYLLYYQMLKTQYRIIVKRTNDEFPYYLNNLAILVQQNVVPIALNKSIQWAPEIFKHELRELVYEIHNNNVSIEPYLRFAKKFENIEDINRVMRTLYNLALKANNREIMITSLSKITNEKLSNQIKLDYKKKLDKQQMLPYILFMWLGLLIIQMIMAIDLF